MKAALAALTLLSGCAIDASRTQSAEPIAVSVGSYNDGLSHGKPVAVYLRRDMLGASVNSIIGLDNQRHGDAAVIRGELVSNDGYSIGVRDGDRVVFVMRDAIIAVEQLVE